MKKAEKLAIAKKLFDILNAEHKVAFIDYANSEYEYELKYDYNFGDIVNEFMNDTDLKKYEDDILSVCVQYNSECEELYSEFLAITGFNDHIEFVYSCGAVEEPTKEQIAMSNARVLKGIETIATPDGVAIAHALEMSKANPDMKVEISFMVDDEPTSFYIIKK